MIRFKSFYESKDKEKPVETGFIKNKDGTVSIDHDTSNDRGDSRKKKKVTESLIAKAKSALGIKPAKADHERSFDDHAASHNKVDHTEHLKKHSANVHKDPHESSAVSHFKSTSRNINHNLIDYHKRGLSNHYESWEARSHARRGAAHEEEDHDSEAHVHHTILKHSKPVGKKMTLYHGTGHDFGAAAKKSKDGIVHSPAHMSTSHDHNVSKEFADHTENDSKTKHVVAIHMDKKDKAVHLDGQDHKDPNVNKHRSEKETVIPAGTKLKHIKSHTTSDGYTIHHFKVHSQELNKDD